MHSYTLFSISSFELQEEEFHGFSAKEVSQAENKLKHAIREKQQFQVERSEEFKERYERSQARLADFHSTLLPSHSTGVVFKKTYKKLIESELVTDANSKFWSRRDYFVSNGTSTSGVNNHEGLKQIKLKRLTHNIDGHGVVKRKRGRPKTQLCTLDNVSKFEKGDMVIAPTLFSTAKYKSRAQHILAKATKHAAQTISSANRVRKFILPTKSSRSSRVIKPTKRFLEEDMDDVSEFAASKQVKFGPPNLSSAEALSASSTFSLTSADVDASNSFSFSSGQGMSVSPLLASREKGFPCFSTAPQPSGTSSFTDSPAGQKPVGLLDQPLIIEGKRSKRPSLIMRMKLVEDDPEDEIRLQQQLTDNNNGGTAVSECMETEAEGFEDEDASASSPFGQRKTLIAPAKLSLLDPLKTSPHPTGHSSKHKKSKSECLSSTESQTVVLRKPKLKLNMKALNRSKMALAKSFKAQLIEDVVKVEDDSSFEITPSDPSTSEPASVLGQLSPFSKTSVTAEVDRQKSGLFEGMSDGVGSFSPNEPRKDSLNDRCKYSLNNHSKDPLNDCFEDPLNDPPKDPLNDHSKDCLIDPPKHPPKDPLNDHSKDRFIDPPKDPLIDPPKDPPNNHSNDPLNDRSKDTLIDLPKDPLNDSSKDPTNGK